MYYETIHKVVCVVYSADSYVTHAAECVAAAAHAHVTIYDEFAHLTLDALVSDAYIPCWKIYCFYIHTLFKDLVLYMQKKKVFSAAAHSVK